MTTKQRCTWPGVDPFYVAYHDDEWGVPEYDDRALYEKLMLDGFQAGLSWITILRKRENFRAAFDNWPEQHAFQPSSAEHLRAWLLCKARWFTVETHELSDDPTMREKMVAFGEALIDGVNKQAKESTEFRFGRWHGSSYAVFSPRTIAWGPVGQKEFGPVREAVSEIIALEVGVTADKLLQGAESVA